MTHDALVWTAWVVLFALVLLMYLLNVWAVLCHTETHPWIRWLGVVPPLALILAWRAGHRVRPITTVILGIAYLVTRVGLS